MKEKKKIEANDVFLIRLKNEFEIQAFPFDAREVICNRINELLDLGIDNDAIVTSILDDFNNIQDYNNDSWIANFKFEEINEIKEKLRNQKYYKPIISYFNFLIDIISKLKIIPIIPLNEIMKEFNLSESVLYSIAKSIFSEKEYIKRYTNRKIHTEEAKYRQILYEFLDSKKDLIKFPYNFIPTYENIITHKKELKAMHKRRLIQGVTRWLLKNNIPLVNEMLKLKRGREDVSIILGEILDSKKHLILSGNYIPNLLNLLNTNETLKEYPNSNINSFVNRWLQKNSKFKNLSDLIKHFKPTPTQLGYTQNDQQKKLFTFIDKYVNILRSTVYTDLSLEFYKKVKGIYLDILDSIVPTSNRNKFDIFYIKCSPMNKKNITQVSLRSEKFLALIFIFYSLFLEVPYIRFEDGTYNISLKKLSDVFKINYHSTKNYSKKIFYFLIKIPKYKIVFDKMSEVSNKAKIKNIIFDYFDWKPDRFKYIKNSFLQKSLYHFLSKIEKNCYPNFLFQLGFPRSSDVKFKGTNEYPVLTKTIRSFFMVKYNLVKKITEDDHFYAIIKETQNIYEYHNTSNLGLKGHEIITDFFLSDDFCFNEFIPIAKEVPLFVFFPDNILTGHIDILVVYCNTIIVLDFKPDGVSDILKSLPQLTIYGILIKYRIAQILEKINGNHLSLDVLCIGFSRKNAYKFNPFLVYKKIPEFLDFEKIRSNRKSPIKNMNILKYLRPIVTKYS